MKQELFEFLKIFKNIILIQSGTEVTIEFFGSFVLGKIIDLDV